jgi:hypothetical protein
MKLYVWEDVLRDYTAGMIVALAHDLDEAIALFPDDETVRAEMGKVKPTVTALGECRSVKAEGWYVWGGG